ncbi:MAG: hypothetical protein WBG02_13700 [Candidatus Acidiferrum sp.]
MSRILQSNVLWKTVENRSVSAPSGAAHHEPLPPALAPAYEAFPQALRACSACAGDYEDPDRTAWTQAAEDDEERLDEAPNENDGDAPAGSDEFPAQEA